MKYHFHRTSFVLIVLSCLYLCTVHRVVAQGSASKCESVKTQVSDLQKQTDELQVQVERDQQAIRNLGFDKKAEEFEDWENVLEEAKRNLKKATLDRVLTSAFLNFEGAIKAAGALNPVTAYRMIRELQESGYDFAPVIASIRRIARVQGKPAYRVAVLNIHNSLEKAKDAAMVDYDSGLQTTMLDALAKALGYGLKDPRLALTVANIDNFVALVYSETAKDISREQIDQLTRLTEKDLRSLGQISDLLRTHVHQLNKARQEFNKSNQRLSNCLSAANAVDCERQCDKITSDCMDRALKSPNPFQALGIETECLKAERNCKQACQQRKPE